MIWKAIKMRWYLMRLNWSIGNKEKFMKWLRKFFDVWIDMEYELFGYSRYELNEEGQEKC